MCFIWTENTKPVDISPSSILLTLVEEGDTEKAMVKQFIAAACNNNQNYHIDSIFGS